VTNLTAKLEQHVRDVKRARESKHEERRQKFVTKHGDTEFPHSKAQFPIKTIVRRADHTVKVGQVGKNIHRFSGELYEIIAVSTDNPNVYRIQRLGGGKVSRCWIHVDQLRRVQIEEGITDLTKT